ncbi:hypothetical protein HWV62_11329 [Athelia sp. TMB]|nr:hypothetical protein HWV62_11329 [Athelia sp. TMB]
MNWSAGTPFPLVNEISADDTSSVLDDPVHFNDIEVVLEGGTWTGYAPSTGLSEDGAQTGPPTEQTSLLEYKISSIQGRQVLGFSLLYYSQATVDAGLPIIAHFPESPDICIPFFPANDPEALGWSQLAFLANIVTDCILTMDDGSYLLILATGNTFRGAAMWLNTPYFASHVDLPPPPPSAGGLYESLLANASSDASPSPDHAILAAAASSSVPVVKSTWPSPGTSASPTKRKAPDSAVPCKHPHEGHAQHPCVPAAMIGQPEDSLPDASTSSSGVAMIGTETGRLTLPAADLAKIYKPHAVVCFAGTNRRQDFSRHRNSKHRDEILAEEYTPLFECTSCHLINVRKDVVDRHWERICKLGKVQKGGPKKAAEKTQKCGKKTGRRVSKMGLISSKDKMKVLRKLPPRARAEDTNRTKSTQVSQPQGSTSTKYQPGTEGMRLQGIDLRLTGFFPALLAPPAANIPLTIGLVFLTVANFTLTYPGSLLAFLTRLFLAPLTIQQFLQYAYGSYVTPGVNIDVGLCVVGLYGVMRVLETTFVSIADTEHARWIETWSGKRLPLPTTLAGRAAYAVDLTMSLRGTSLFANKHWDWTPRALVPGAPDQYPTRWEFVRRRLASLLPQILVIDIVDSIAKSRIWPREPPNPHPITSLPVHEQFVFSICVCVQTALALSLTHTVFAAAAVAAGSSPSAWPPMLRAPFTGTTSLRDFWTHRWHLIFRRVFGRLARAVPLVPYAVTIFAFSALLHILLMYRIDMHVPAAVDPTRTLFDTSILKFFLVQPLGLLIEALFVLPLIGRLPAGWQTSAGRIWTWAWMLWTGRYWSDVWVHRGFWEPQERAVGWSVVRGVLYGKWAI